MSHPSSAPPATPPPVNPGVTYQDNRGGDGHIMRVTRNVPPKRVMVTPGSTIGYGGKTFTEGDTFLIGEGPVADQFALQGQVVVIDHDAVDAWNGEEGDKIRKEALAVLDDEHKARGEDRTHDHGFVKYEHADPDNPIPMDITQHRQQLGMKHMMENRAATAEDFGSPKKKGGSR